MTGIENVVIKNVKGLEHFEGKNYAIVDGIVVIEKNAVIPDGTVIWKALSVK